MATRRRTRQASDGGMMALNDHGDPVKQGAGELGKSTSKKGKAGNKTQKKQPSRKSNSGVSETIDQIIDPKTVKKQPKATSTSRGSDIYEIVGSDNASDVDLPEEPKPAKRGRKGKGKAVNIQKDPPEKHEKANPSPKKDAKKITQRGRAGKNQGETEKSGEQNPEDAQGDEVMATADQEVELAENEKESLEANGENEKTNNKKGKPNKTKRKIKNSPKTKRKESSEIIDEAPEGEESQDEDELLKQVSLEKSTDRIIHRMTNIRTALNKLIKQVSPDNNSIKKHLRVIEQIVEEDAEELDTQGTYPTVYQYHPKLRGRYKPLPLVLPGDPFPDPYSTEFDENDPGVQELFKSDEIREQTIGIYEDHIKRLDASMRFADELAKNALKVHIVLQEYNARLGAQQKFIQRLSQHEKTVKEEYINRRISERERNIRNRHARSKRKILDDHERPQSSSNTLKRKLTSSPGDQEANARKKHIGPGGLRRNVSRSVELEVEDDISDNPDDGNVEFEESENVPDADIGSEDAPPPAPIERVRIESFGDHRPGKPRRYENTGRRDQGVSPRIQNGILVDAEWTDAEYLALNEAMKKFIQIPGRWLDIKATVGEPGGELANRSAAQIQAKAKELKEKFLRNNKVLPSYWDNLEW